MTGTIILCFPCKDRHTFHSCMLLQDSVKSEKRLAEAECEADLPKGEPFTIKGNIIVRPWCRVAVTQLTVADVVKSQSHVITRADSPGHPEHSRARIKLSERKTNAPALMGVVHQQLMGGKTISSRYSNGKKGPC